MRSFFAQGNAYTLQQLQQLQKGVSKRGQALGFGESLSFLTSFGSGRWRQAEALRLTSYMLPRCRLFASQRWVAMMRAFIATAKAIFQSADFALVGSSPALRPR